MKSPYRIKHWSPVKKFQKAQMDGGIYQNTKILKQMSMELQNLEISAINNLKQAEKANREWLARPTKLFVGNGILDQIKPPEPIILKVEDIYEWVTPEYWPILDELLEDRPDLQERIEKYKRSTRAMKTES